MRTLDELGAAKLQPTEAELVREAADTLLFSEAGAAEVLDEVERLLHRLVDSGRWTEERAAQLSADLGECGPVVLA